MFTRANVRFRVYIKRHHKVFDRDCVCDYVSCMQDLMGTGLIRSIIRGESMVGWQREEKRQCQLQLKDSGTSKQSPQALPIVNLLSLPFSSPETKNSLSHSSVRAQLVTIALVLIYLPVSVLNTSDLSIRCRLAKNLSLFPFAFIF